MAENNNQENEELIEQPHPYEKTINCLIKNAKRQAEAEIAANGDCMSGNTGSVVNATIQLIPHIIDSMVSKNMIGIQPMQGPVGLVYSLQVKQQEENPDKPMEGRRMSVQVVSQTVEARTRKFDAKWNLEHLTDLKATLGEDTATEQCLLSAAEIAEEIDSEIICDLITLAGNTGEAFYTDSEYLSIRKTINQAAMRIADTIRCGRGNHVMMSTAVAMKIIDDPLFFTPMNKEDLKEGNIVIPSAQLIGEYRDREDNKLYDVYTYPPTLNSIYNETIIVGYKGNNGETDSGYFYCPYILTMSSGVVIDPATFQPILSLKTRYGKTIAPISNCDLNKETLKHYSNYYRVVNVTGLEY